MVFLIVYKLGKEVFFFCDEKFYVILGYGLVMEFDLNVCVLVVSVSLSMNVLKLLKGGVL